jgi:hypothetical protein
MLATERSIVTLPDNETWPSASWFKRFGLTDDTAHNARRERVEQRLGGAR